MPEVRALALRVHGAMTDIRVPTEADRAAILALGRLSFNVPVEWAERLGPTLRLDRYRCAYEGDRLVATAFAHPLSQWFGGNPVPMAGVAGVATIPERRGTGVGSEVMRALLREVRDNGALISTLYPATVPFYRRLGYEYGGAFTTFEVPLTDLPPGESGAIEEVQGDALDALRSCYRAFCMLHNGLVESEEHGWWRHRVLREWNADLPRRTAIVRAGGDVRGYAAYRLESRTDGDGYDILCTHLVGMDAEALGALLGYFRRFHGVGESLKWQGPPNEPLALLIPEQSLEIEGEFRFMTRLLDVAGALEARGYPEVSGEATISVEDDLFADNAGPFHVTADDGKVNVERIEVSDALRIPIGALSTMYTGYAAPADLVRTGSLPAGHPALPFLTRLFAGPPPWSADFF